MRAFEFIVSIQWAGANCRIGAPKAHFFFSVRHFSVGGAIRRGFRLLTRTVLLLTARSTRALACRHARRRY